MKKNFLGIIVTVIIAICLLSLTALADTTVNTADGDITISTDNNGNKLVNGTTYTGVLTITGEKRANATIESGTHDIVISDTFLDTFYVVSGSKVNLTIKGQNKM